MTAIRLSALLAALFLLAAVHVAQDAPEKPAVTPIKPLELYKLKGRAWSHRITEWTRGGKLRVVNESSNVTELDAEWVTHETSYAVEGASERGTSTARVRVDHSTPREKVLADERLPEETLDMGFAQFACRKHVAKEEGVQTTTWVSAKYHPLIVKQVKLGKDTCEIRKLTSFNSAAVDPWSLYLIAGRSWTVRTTVKLQGMDPMVTYSRNRIAAVSAAGATVEMEVLDKDKKAFGGMDPTKYEVAFAAPEFSGPPPGPPPAITRETCRCEVAEFDCYRTEVAQTKSWTSVQWPGLMVRMEADNMESELVDFDLGHDDRKLYRKPGNFFVVKTTTAMAGMRDTMRSEVMSVADGTAKIKLSTKDGNGEMFSQDDEMEVPEAEAPFMPYDGQIEESVTTPAGTFRCIRSEVEATGATAWMHHGVLVKMTMKIDNFEVTQELIELKME